MLEHGARARARREELAGAEVALAADGEAAWRQRVPNSTSTCRPLRVARRAAAPRLALAVREQLASLAMGDATFEVILAGATPVPRAATPSSS